MRQMPSCFSPTSKSGFIVALRHREDKIICLFHSKRRRRWYDWQGILGEDRQLSGHNQPFEQRKKFNPFPGIGQIVP